MPKAHGWTRLYSALFNLEERVDFAEEMSLPASMAIATLMVNITKMQPHGHIEYDPRNLYAEGTVSDRLGHTPISDGWRTGIVDGPDGGVTMQVKNISEHISHVIYGTGLHGKKGAKYPIPGSAPSVFFWWGRPQRWQPANLKPGYYKFPVVLHPGQEANPFLPNAIQLSRPDMRAKIKHGIGKWITNIMSRFGLRQK